MIQISLQRLTDFLDTVSTSEDLEMEGGLLLQTICVENNVLRLLDDAL